MNQLNAFTNDWQNTHALAMCPASCGCVWLNNGDGTIRLFGPNSNSCDVCETLPWDGLVPVCIKALASQPSQEIANLYDAAFERGWDWCSVGYELCEDINKNRDYSRDKAIILAKHKGATP